MRNIPHNTFASLRIWAKKSGLTYRNSSAFREAVDAVRRLTYSARGPRDDTDAEVALRIADVSQGVLLQKHLEVDLGMGHQRSLVSAACDARDRGLVGTTAVQDAYRANAARHKRWVRKLTWTRTDPASPVQAELDTLKSELTNIETSLVEAAKEIRTDIINQVTVSVQNPEVPLVDMGSYVSNMSLQMARRDAFYTMVSVAKCFRARSLLHDADTDSCRRGIGLYCLKHCDSGLRTRDLHVGFHGTRGDYDQQDLDPFACCMTPTLSCAIDAAAQASNIANRTWALAGAGGPLASTIPRSSQLCMKVFSTILQDGDVRHLF